MKSLVQSCSVPVVTAVLLAGAGIATHAAADTLDDHATFNNPNDAINRAAIQSDVIQLINGTPAGATIRISTFLFASGADAARSRFGK